MTSKLDPQRKARDHRRNDKERKKRKRHHERDPLPIHIDATSIVFASQQPDAESRFITMDVLPDMTEEWIDKIVYIRQPLGGVPDRAFLGIQNLDDSLVWIELSLAAAAPPNEANEPPPPVVSASVTFQRRLLVYANPHPSNFMGIEWYLSPKIWLSAPDSSRAKRHNRTTGAFEEQAPTVTGVPAGIGARSDWNRFAVADSSVAGSTARIRIYTTVTVPASLDKTISLGGPQILRDVCYNDPGGTSTHVMVADVTAGQIKRFLVSSGAAAGTRSAGGISGLLLFGDTDGLYYTRQGANTLTKCAADLTGADIFSVGSSGSGNGQFNAPGGLCGDGFGDRVWVCDSLNHRVQAFNATTGAYLGQFGGTANGSPGSDSTTATLETPIDIIGVNFGVGQRYLYVLEAGTSSPLVPTHVSEWLIAEDFPE